MTSSLHRSLSHPLSLSLSLSLSLALSLSLSLDARTCPGQVEASKRKYDALQHHVAAIKLAEAADEDKVPRS